MPFHQPNFSTGGFSAQRQGHRVPGCTQRVHPQKRHRGRAAAERLQRSMRKRLTGVPGPCLRAFRF